MEEALNYQRQHLAEWEKVLKPEVFAKLRALVVATNSTVTNPYDVCRGTAIECFIHNAAYHKII